MCPVSAEVMRHDLRAALPFKNDEFDGVYHSHVLEHLPRADGERFLRECWRVLLPGGTIRVVVPDLETLARLYLKHLEGAVEGDAELLVLVGGGEEFVRLFQSTPTATTTLSRVDAMSLGPT